VTIEPGAPGWYCFLDIYSGDGHYTSATDNTSTECLDVTTSQVTANAASPGPTPAIGAGSTSTTGGPAVLIGDTPSPASSAMEARRPL
jgi:F420-dependent methylenetetrahydromethanopterin dehydrogenase